MQTPQVNVGGIWLSSLGPWGELEIEDRWPGGCYELRCTIDPKLSRRHPAVINEAPVFADVMGPRWAGTLAEYDPETGEIVAQGYYRQGDGAPALNSSGATTTVPDHAVAKGISAGWLNWILAGSLSSSPYSAENTAGDATAQVNATGALLDEWSASVGKRWGVDELRAAYAAADPTVATHLLVNVPAPPESRQRAVGTVVARWRDAAGAFFTTIRGNAQPVKLVDFTEAGPLTSSKVTARCDKILAATLGGSTYGGFTITRDQIIGRTHLSAVRAGHKVAIVDQASADLSILGPALVLGATVWNADEDTVACTPVDAPDLDLESIVAAQGGTLE